jgi:hypothetical protein
MDADELVRAVHEAAVVGGIMVDQVPDPRPGEPFAEEWKTFKREVYRLLSAGNRGRFALIKGDQVVSVWDTHRDALQAGRERSGQEPFFVQEVQLYVKPVRSGCCVAPGGTLMTDKQESLVARLHREEVERLRGAPVPPPELPEINLPEEPADPAFAAEWKLFRQEVARLLVEGKRGRFALIKAGHPLTVWDTLADAAQASRLLYGNEPCLLQEIQLSLRPLRVGYNRPCRD